MAKGLKRRITHQTFALYSTNGDKHFKLHYHLSHMLQALPFHNYFFSVNLGLFVSNSTMIRLKKAGTASYKIWSWQLGHKGLTLAFYYIETAVHGC